MPELRFWRELNRVQLAHLLPEALVVLPTGATEQHGPYLPTGTDALIVEQMTIRAVRHARTDRPIIIAPTIAIGASDHHFPFGGTLSLRVETMHDVLVDVARSIAMSGGNRLVLINGHGGNQGPCTTAAAVASSRHDIRVAYCDYWAMTTMDSDDASMLVPGHAGAFEASMDKALFPDLVTEIPSRGDSPIPWGPVGVQVHTTGRWTAMDGYTDDPSLSSTEAGKQWAENIVRTLAELLDELAEKL